MKDLNFREGDAKTSIFGSNEMLKPSPVDRIPVHLQHQRSHTKWLKTKHSLKHNLDKSGYIRNHLHGRLRNQIDE